MGKRWPEKGPHCDRKKDWRRAGYDGVEEEEILHTGRCLELPPTSKDARFIPEVFHICQQAGAGFSTCVPLWKHKPPRLMSATSKIQQPANVELPRRWTTRAPSAQRRQDPMCGAPKTSNGKAEKPDLFVQAETCAKEPREARLRCNIMLRRELCNILWRAMLAQYNNSNRVIWRSCTAGMHSNRTEWKTIFLRSSVCTKAGWLVGIPNTRNLSTPHPNMGVNSLWCCCQLSAFLEVPASVPDLSLAQMNSDARKLPQIQLEPCMKEHKQRNCRRGTQTSARHCGGNVGWNASLVLPKRKEHGHERVALFAAFTLMDDVGTIILPQIL